MIEYGYEIVRADSVAALEEAVRAKLASGWLPIGGLVFRPFEPSRREETTQGTAYSCYQPAYYMQAMTRGPTSVAGYVVSTGGSGDKLTDEPHPPG